MLTLTHTTQRIWFLVRECRVCEECGESWYHCRHIHKPSMICRFSSDRHQFIGPTPDVIESLGDKVSARKLAMKCQVPVVPGTEGPVGRFEDAKKFTDEYGFPIIIKAAFGGGGRGMRVVRDQESLKDSFERATSEAKSAFGNGTVFIERFLDKPKHIEVQILGDNHGNIVHLYERDCSVQRRHQKVVELAPAKDLPQETRDNILNDAVKLAKSVKYRNAGTAEFLVDQQNRYYFIEINPRMYVLSPISSSLTEVDCMVVKWNIPSPKRLPGSTLSPLRFRLLPVQLCRNWASHKMAYLHEDMPFNVVSRPRIQQKDSRPTLVRLKFIDLLVVMVSVSMEETDSREPQSHRFTIPCLSSVHVMLLLMRLQDERCFELW